MRKLAQYRRNNHPNSGFKEKVAWQLSKGPRTGQQLADLFGMTLSQFNHQIRDCFNRSGETLKLSATDPVITESGASDRTYSLARKPRRVAVGKGKPMVISRTQEASQEARQQAIIAARRRARLIKQGRYIDNFC